MISFDEKVFRLSTAQTSYIFRITSFGHLEHIYYGPLLPPGQDIEPLALKRSAQIGSSVAYDPSDDFYSLDNIPLEWSGVGKGDYRHSPSEIKMPDGGFTEDFVYESHAVIPGCVPMETLPSAYGGEEDCETLELRLRDKSCDVTLTLYYSVYAETNVICRRCVLRNGEARPLTIRKLMSMCLDIPDDGFELVTFDGGWGKEGHKHSRRVNYGIYVNSSTTGSSSNRHNPGFLLAKADTTQMHGDVYGFNLVYSGNHYGAVELSNHELLRIQLGINPHCFEWTLGENERFETPEAVLSYSGEGFNGLSHNFHDFINRHIVRGDWKGEERPVLLNNWEAHFFKFTRGKLLRLARRAKKAGAELFVLDDGWFGQRNSDMAGLGDYNVNRKKLPRGLSEFSGRIHAMDLKFGLWFEPEMVNEDSDLFRAHPEYAVRTPGRVPARGRNQLVLDLCNENVRDYIVENVTRTLDDARVDYVKWDFNRHLSDVFSEELENQGEFYHRYVIGLYEVLHRIFSPRPHILFESCSSGGNRFDLGMLCFSPQIWTSDDTDPIERLKIQGGLSYLYPLSTMGAHVSEAPHQQTLRETPLVTRFNVASFGCLGYELDLRFLNHVERKELKEQVEFYKRHRRTLQYGRFWRGEDYKDNKVIWHCVSEDKSEGITGFFQTQTMASEGFDRLRFAGLGREKSYRVSTRPQPLFVRRFGGLVRHIIPVTLDPAGFLLRTANKYITIPDCVEEYEARGDVLERHGVLLNNQFIGSYYNDKVRLLGDFGSNLYLVEEKGEKTGDPD